VRVEARPQTGEGSVGSIDTIAEAPFYIAPTGPSARPRRTLKQDDAFAVFDSHGDMGASAGGPDGLFDHDTRCLSRLELLINGMHGGDVKLPDLLQDAHRLPKARSVGIVIAVGLSMSGRCRA
jgi:N-terminal domain of (some) glycogen debranching enzymes